MNTLQLILKIYSICLLTTIVILEIYSIIKKETIEDRIVYFVGLILNIPILIYLIKY